MNKKLSSLRALFFGLALVILSPVLHAEQKVVQSGYEIHYSAIPSSFLTPEVAQAYGLTRSRVMALLNIAVLKINEDGSTTPVNALVSGEAKNLVQQVKYLQFRQIKEVDAIYYISTFRFSNEEQLTFDINVQPDPNQPAIKLRFSQTFYEG